MSRSAAVLAPATPARPDARGPFSAVAVAGLLAVGIGAFCALVVLAAYAPDLRGDERGGNTALSRSAVGFAALVDLLRATGVPVAVSREGASARGRSRGLFVVTPPAGHDAGAVRTLAAAAAATLLILPKWDTSRDRDHPGWVRKNGLAALDRIVLSLPAAAVLARRSGEGRPELTGVSDAGVQGLPTVAGIEELQTLKPSATWEAVVADDTGRAVLARWVGHDLYVLTDPDLLDTQGLKDPAVARTAAGIVDALRAGGPVTFDVTLNGFGKVRSLLRLLFEPPLLGGTLCAAAAALLVLLMALRRFGPPARDGRSVAMGKRALADNAARLIARAGREPAMAAPYASAVRAAVTRGLGARPGAGRAVPDAALDALSRAAGLPDTWSDLAASAEAARDRAALMRVADNLHRWSLGMGRGHR